jgi:hypothetical protein
VRSTYFRSRSARPHARWFPNGYGHDAIKLARSLFEIELNVFWLKAHPEDLDDFLDYTFIDQKQIYDLLTDEERGRVPKDRYNEMMKGYKSVLPRFTTGRDKTTAQRVVSRLSI